MLFSCQVLFFFAPSDRMVFVSNSTFSYAYLIPFKSNNNQDHSNTQNDLHDQEEHEESEGNEEGKELELLSDDSNSSKYAKLQITSNYFYLLKSLDGVFNEKFSPPDSRFKCCG